jgi:UDP-4-amino-4-deoxy-L-arabinose formyltransferase/UDP-glucuronic acid dehydrogenase (UDP-4-keto-hexauronic acid decarboxylating)
MFIPLQLFHSRWSEDDIATAYAKVARTSRNMISKNLRGWVRGQFEGLEQDFSQATYYARRCSEDGRFSFDMNALSIDRMVRALTKPFLGAFFFVGGNKVTVWRSRVAPEQSDFIHVPGTIVGQSSKHGVFVVAGDNSVLELVRVQVNDAPEMWAADVYATLDKLFSV